MKWSPNRFEKLVLVVPIWHIVFIVVAIGVTAGFVAGTTSINIWVVRFVAIVVALTILFLDVLTQRRRGFKHVPGTWSRTRD